MNRDIHLLFDDIQELINGRREFKSRAEQTAQDLGLSEVADLISNGQYGAARAEVIQTWKNRSDEYAYDMTEYVPGRLQVSLRLE